MQVLSLTEAPEFKPILTEVKKTNYIYSMSKSTDVSSTCIFLFSYCSIKGCLLLQLFNLKWEIFLAGTLEGNSSVLRRRRGRSALISRRLWFPSEQFATRASAQANTDSSSQLNCKTPKTCLQWHPKQEAQHSYIIDPDGVPRSFYTTYSRILYSWQSNFQD